MVSEMISDEIGNVSEEEIPSEERPKITDSLRDPSVNLGVSLPSACRSNICQESSEMAIIRGEETMLRSMSAGSSLVTKDFWKKWRANWKTPRCHIPEIWNIEQTRRWKITQQTVSIASQKYPGILFFESRASERLMGGGSFSSKFPRVVIKIEERHKVLAEAIRAIEGGIEESADNEIYRGLQILTNLKEVNRLPSYSIGSVRRLIDILCHPFVQSKATKFNPVLSSVVDYFVALHLKQALENEDSEYFNEVNICNNHNVLDFMNDLVKSEHYSQLIQIVTARKPQMNTASANAITILNKVGYCFVGKDLRGVFIKGANLSGGNFTRTDFSGSIMAGVNLKKCNLTMTNLFLSLIHI